MGGKVWAIGLSISAFVAAFFALKMSGKARGKSMTYRELYEDNFCEKWECY